jgi:hypothetical protein
MNTINTDRLTAVLSGILTDRYGAKITVTLQEEKNDTDRDNPDSSNTGSVRYSRIHPVFPLV